MGRLKQTDPRNTTLKKCMPVWTCPAVCSLPVRRLPGRAGNPAKNVGLQGSGAPLPLEGRDTEVSPSQFAVPRQPAPLLHWALPRVYNQQHKPSVSSCDRAQDVPRQVAIPSKLRNSLSFVRPLAQDKTQQHCLCLALSEGLIRYLSQSTLRFVSSVILPLLRPPDRAWRIQSLNHPLSQHLP